MAKTLAEIEKSIRDGTFVYSNGSTKMPDKSYYYTPENPAPPQPTQPQQPAQNTAPPSAPSTPPSSPSKPVTSYPPAPQAQPSLPQRWNADADYTTRLGHFGGNIDDAKSEILAVKDIYNKEMNAGASAERLGQIHDWANQVRGAAGISNDDMTYGNGVAKPTITPPPTAPNTDGMAETIRKKYMADLADQTAAINQALQQALQANESAVGRNKQMLEETIRSLTQQKLVNDNAAAELQNRRGGFYSGGLDYQLGSIARATTQAQEGATRDINARNAEIYGRNALLAQQAADNIQRLQSAAPDRIRELIRQATNDDRQFGLQQQQFDRGVFESDRNYNYKAERDQVADQKYDQEFSYKVLRDQIEDEKYKQKFDEDVRRYGLEYAADQAYKNAQIRNMNADNARQDAAAARQAGNQQLANLYEIWDRTGVAPDGIPGVRAGTPLAGKSSSGSNSNALKYTSDLNKMYVSTDSSGKPVVNNAPGLRSSIIALNLPDSETDALLTYYGLAINE